MSPEHDEYGNRRKKRKEGTTSGNTRKPKNVEYKASLTGAFMGVFVAIVGTGASFVMRGEIKDDPNNYFTTGMLCISLLGLPFGIAGFIHRPVTLRLSKKGLYLRRIKKTIPWSAIEQCYFYNPYDRYSKSQQVATVVMTKRKGNDLIGVRFTRAGRKKYGSFISAMMRPNAEKEDLVIGTLRHNFSLAGGAKDFVDNVNCWIKYYNN